MILTPNELAAFTGKTERAQKRYSSQAKVLRAMGIPYLPRPDKTLIVYRSHTDATRTPQKEQVDSPALVLP